MTAPLAGRLAELAGVLGDSLAQWATRDDSIPQPEVREAANTACDAIDAMLAELHRARAALVAEVRQSDDASVVRAEALLAKLRSEVTATGHSTYMGRRRTGSFGGGPLHFARCHCGWEGPSRIDRPTAVRDGQEHLEAPTAESAPEVAR